MTEGAAWRLDEGQVLPCVDHRPLFILPERNTVDIGRRGDAARLCQIHIALDGERFEGVVIGQDQAAVFIRCDGELETRFVGDGFKLVHASLIGGDEEQGKAQGQCGQADLLLLDFPRY
ncbi:hypothetical protein SDC9_211659 [bioreactor metagenome]|uniref:Uncharacterized protein n=1 Tax=bioreactor metagenome TaxID=1076179 RepID=A0A645JKW2_9ZZZZ